MEQAIQSVQSFFKRKDVVISAHRYGKIGRAHV